MKVGNNQQFTHNITIGSGKVKAGDASYLNITDSFKPTGKKEDTPDLRKAAQVLLQNEELIEVKDLWENDQRGIAFCANSERVVMGSYNDKVTAVDPTSGKVKWETEHKGFVTEGKDGTLFVSGTDKNLYALDPKTGKDKWSKEFESDVRVFDTGDDGTLYARSGGNVIALDPDTREIKHQCKVIGDPVMGKDGMVYGGGPDAHKLRAYDLKTGEQKWETNTQGMVRCAPAVSKDGKTVYVGEVKSNCLVAYDAKTGKQKWRYDTGHGIVASPIVNDDETVIVGNIWPGAKLFGINPDTGKLKWTFDSKDDFRDGLAFAPDGTLLAPTGCFVNAIDPKYGKLKWKKEGKSYVFAPPVVGSEGRMYFGTNGAGMHCIQDPKMVEHYLKEEGIEVPIEAEKNLTIEQGKGFIEIGGVKLRVNK